jgi:hypothetical protein
VQEEAHRNALEFYSKFAIAYRIWAELNDKWASFWVGLRNDIKAFLVAHIFTTYFEESYSDQNVFHKRLIIFDWRRLNQVNVKGT